MTSSHDALYRAICAHPDEDTPRLMFADALDEAGDPIRARFIRTQVALAHAAPFDPEWVAARRHGLDVYGCSMAHTLPKVPGGYGWHRFEFRRGFPWKVGVLSLGTFLDAGEGVFEAAPIQALDVDARDRPNLSLLADWAHIRKLQKLEFSVGWFGADDVNRLADSEGATNLRELAFEFDGISPDGLTALAASALFEQLTALELRSNAIPPALLVESLGAAGGPGNLRRVSLPFTRLGRDDAERLFALPALRGVRHLDVSDNNQLGMDGVAALAASRLVRNLEVLNLSNTHPGVPGVKALTAARGLSGLRMLDLSANRLGPVAIKTLAECAGLRGLRSLNLSKNAVGDAGAKALATARPLGGLIELDLRDADVCDAGALALAESPHLDNLLRLDLRAAGRPLGSAARNALLERFGDKVSV